MHWDRSGWETTPDATALLEFRRLPEVYNLNERVFTAINTLEATERLRPRVGRVLDTTIVESPTIKEDNDGMRKPEMLQAKKMERSDTLAMWVRKALRSAKKMCTAR